MTLPEHPDLTQDNSTSPGPRLREARLEKKLSLEEVAGRLHLDPHLVRSLESDDYAELPEPTFVRGYLRGYARLLNLPPGPIIEAYDRHGFKPPNLVADIASRPQARSTDFSVRLVTFLVVALLVGLPIAWWQTQEVAPRENHSTSGYPEPAESGIGPVDIAGVGQHVPVPLAMVGTGRPPSPAEPVEPEPPVAVAPPGPKAAATPPPAGTAPAETPQGTAAGSDTAAAPETAPVTPSAPAEPPVAVGPRSHRLQMTLAHDAWVEVYGKGGKRLFFNLAKADQTLSLEGEPPFRVLLGYAKDAKIEYNGELFDYRPFTKKGVARFTLGEGHNGR